MLPAAASLQKQGANKGATTAFLISTPESGVDSIAVTYALLDPIMTVVRPVAAFVTAMSAGVLENFLSFSKSQETLRVAKNCPIDNCCDGIDCPPDVHKAHHTLRERVKAGLGFAVVDVWGDIVAWFFIGLVLAGIITALVPEDFMAAWLGGGLVSMLLMLVFGIPLYICATASTPIAAALILKGVSPGAALVFLLVGPATNVTSLSVLVGILGKKSVVRYLIVLSVMAVLFGLGVDSLYHLAGISPAAVLGEASEILPFGLKFAATVVLLLLSIKPLWQYLKKLFKRDKSNTAYFSDFPSLHCSTAKKSNDTMHDLSLPKCCNTDRKY